MDKKLKNALRQAYTLPSPEGKDEFLKQFREPLTGYREFFLSQAGYIKKRAALMSFIILAAILYLSLHTDILTISAVSAFMPFLIIFLVTEFSRSVSYNMAELEMSCRYSLADIVLVRSFILGAVQLLCVVSALIICHEKSGISLLMTAAYLLTPYLLSLALSLAVLRRNRSRNIYISVIICCFISFGCITARFLNPVIFSGIYNGLWITALIVLGFVTVYEFMEFKRKLVDNEWNLSLTD